MKPHKKIFLAAFLSLMLFNVKAQKWGNYTLYSVGSSTTTQLIDTNNTVYHTWTHTSTRRTGYSSYLMPGQILWRTVKLNTTTLTGGGMCGNVQKVDWNGTVLFDYTFNSATECSHHDICPLPNGNVLVIVYDVKSASEATQAGCSSAITIWSEKIVELQPTGLNTANIVWQWNLWDHLCQSFDASKNNYVSNTSQHPELYNINYAPQKDIWHMNGIDYNPILDQVIVSAHNTNEFYVIDHSTTTSEAAGHTGGRGGKGGDFLYRWGKPVTYGQTGNTNFNVIHDAHWIPEGVPNAGYMVALNNKGISNTQSCVDMVSPPYSGFTYSYTPNTAYLPSVYTFRRNCNGGTSNMGNSQQLPNGNMLICLALSGVMYEINSQGTTLWTKTATGTVSQAFRYSDCQVNNSAPATPTITQNGNVLTSSPATTYQWYFNGVLMPSETNQTCTITQSGAYQVRVTDANGCYYSYSAIGDFSFVTGYAQYNFDVKTLNIFPNPTTGIINLTGEVIQSGNFEIIVYDALGNILIQSKQETVIDMSAYNNGVYFITINSDKYGIINRKISLLK